MPEPAIRPFVCSPAAARCIGAWFYAEPPEGLPVEDVAAFIVQASRSVSARGLVPVLTHGRGAVWALSVDPDAHRRI